MSTQSVPQSAPSTLKKLHSVQDSLSKHWVGDGFPVNTLLSYGGGMDQLLSPFLLLDHAGPHEFPPTNKRLGVGEHPHRGFETVTIVYDGEVEHRDSSGGGGKIGRGDVQWMTAAAGIVHEEFHGREYAARGGRFEMVQLWVNLPTKDKMTTPGYQGILDSDIPVATLPDGQGSVRVIAGEFAGMRGPAHTYSPLNMWDMRLQAGATLPVAIPEGYSTAVVVLAGNVQVNGDALLKAEQVGIFEHAGAQVHLASPDGATVLLLNGEPLNEPVAGHGPFVMNTQSEIRQALFDYQSGKMGHL